MPFEVLKRRGTFLAKIIGSPLFETVTEAEGWVAAYRLANPLAISIDFETVEIRKVTRDL
jgi:hypothetical protein